ncbi:MAG: trimeric intracellular cation channel family protein [Rhodobacteraceae bacterium]|nr:MAG: trimeric intracellular cation channel family protein [Paracoccaceae bacterium]
MTALSDLGQELATLILMLGYLASAVLAASAALQGVRHGFDPFGATVLAFATALGGGTLRDLFLGRTPVFWIADPTYLAVIIPVALLAYLAARRMPSGEGQRLRLLLRLDAVGLALFTLVGVRIAQDAGAHWIIAIVLGCITGTVGGMIRDVLCNVAPAILREDLYATISLAGGALYLVLDPVIGTQAALAVSFTAMMAARLVTLARKA